MSNTRKIEEQMKVSPSGVRFQDLRKVCEHYFGKSRTRGSHYVYGLPHGIGTVISIQVGKSGKAKPYKVKQVQQAIDNIKSQHHS